MKEKPIDIKIPIVILTVIFVGLLLVSFIQKQVCEEYKTVWRGSMSSLGAEHWQEDVCVRYK